MVLGTKVAYFSLINVGSGFHSLRLVFLLFYSFPIIVQTSMLSLQAL